MKPLVLIEWIDSYGCSATWQSFENPVEPQVMRCASVGYLMHEDAECVVIVPHVAKLEGQADQGCGDMTIPKRSIVKQTALMVDERGASLVSRRADLDRQRAALEAELLKDPYFVGP